MRKCSTPKPTYQAAKPAKSSKTDMPEGSWKCDKCNNINYPFRTKCNRQNCGADKPSESQNPPSEEENNKQVRFVKYPIQLFFFCFRMFYCCLLGASMYVNIKIVSYWLLTIHYQLYFSLV
ncbi:ranBP2-type zinc finger protein At1g67325-like [Helianthus annuus]|nr:ranBP2-type zinc finger protein At1g67325-like [Helianthus annuus]